MIKRLFVFAALVLMAVIFFPLVLQVNPFTNLDIVAQKYVDFAPIELGAQNIVTAVIVTYRGLDTLGEVTVLFIATAGIAFLLRRKKRKAGKNNKRPASELLHTASAFLYPLLIIFGVYIFSHGHLTPGGGFQGGVVIASGVLMLMLSNIDYKPNHSILNVLEGFSGATFVVLGILGLVLAGGFLDNRFIVLGEYGKLFSAGAIGIIYSVIGLKVGSELTGILDSFSQDDDEAELKNEEAKE